MGKVQVTAVSNANISIESGEFIAIAGPSGSGKSTLLNIVGLIDTPTSGKFFLNGEDIYKILNLEQTEKFLRNLILG